MAMRVLMRFGAFAWLSSRVESSRRGQKDLCVILKSRGEEGRRRCRLTTQQQHYTRSELRAKIISVNSSFSLSFSAAPFVVSLSRHAIYLIIIIFCCCSSLSRTAPPLSSHRMINPHNGQDNGTIASLSFLFLFLRKKCDLRRWLHVVYSKVIVVMWWSWNWTWDGVEQRKAMEWTRHLCIISLPSMCRDREWWCCNLI